MSIVFYTPPYGNLIIDAATKQLRKIPMSLKGLQWLIRTNAPLGKAYLSMHLPSGSRLDPETLAKELLSVQPMATQSRPISPEEAWKRAQPVLRQMGATGYCTNKLWGKAMTTEKVCELILDDVKRWVGAELDDRAYNGEWPAVKEQREAFGIHKRIQAHTAFERRRIGLDVEPIKLNAEQMAVALQHCSINTPEQGEMARVRQATIMAYGQAPVEAKEPIVSPDKRIRIGRNATTAGRFLRRCLHTQPRMCTIETDPKTGVGRLLYRTTDTPDAILRKIKVAAGHLVMRHGRMPTFKELDQLMLNDYQICINVREVPQVVMYCSPGEPNAFYATDRVEYFQTNGVWPKEEVDV